MDVPRSVEQTLTARAVDAFEACTAAIHAGDRDALHRAAVELAEVFEDIRAAEAEHGA